MTTLRKDNTGTDLKHLFIGSEGTLGIITECAMLCPVQPKSRQVAVVACENFEAVLKVLQAAKRELPDVMQAIEYMDLASMDVVRDMNPTTVYPFNQDYEHYVLVEVAQTVDPYDSAESGSDYGTELETDRLFNFLECIEDEILDGVVSHDEKQLHQLWYLREGISNSTV
jgi:D-2-hydroxyglutarate dehydrogenase